MIRKITLGLTAILSVFSATSLASPARTPVDIKVPSYNGGFTFGLAGLYLRPSTTELDYGLLFPAAAVGNVPQVDHGTVQSVNPDYDWGYKVNIGYVFPCTGNDVSLAYTHYNQQKSNVLDLRSNEIVFGTIAPFSFLADDFSAASSDAKAEFKYQAVDLDFGQHINVGCNTSIRFLGGLRFADLDTHLNANYYGSVDNDDDTVLENFTVTTAQRSEFKGVGPRFGIDSEYNLGRGFSVVGQAASALLVGHSKSNFHQNDLLTVGTETLLDDTIDYSLGKETRVVPNLTAKLGLAYNYQFCNASRTKLTVEAGYQVDHYFNVVDRLRNKSQADFDEAFNGVNPSKQTLDASFDGPYVGIQVHI